MENAEKEYKVLLAENTTGIVLNPDFTRFQHKENSSTPYVYFDNLEEALQYIENVLKQNVSVECSVFERNKFLKRVTIINGTIHETY